MKRMHANDHTKPASVIFNAMIRNGGDVGKSIQEVARQTPDFEADVLDYCIAARLLGRERHPAWARALSDFAIAQFPNEPCAYYERARLELNLGNSQNYAKFYNKAIACPDGEYYVYMQKGVFAAMKDKYKMAAGFFEDALTKKPDDIFALDRLSRTYLELGRFQDAIDKVGELLVHEYDNPFNHFKLAIGHIKLGEHTEAAKVLENLVGEYLIHPPSTANDPYLMGALQLLNLLARSGLHEKNYTEILSTAFNNKLLTGGEFAGLKLNPHQDSNIAPEEVTGMNVGKLKFICNMIGRGEDRGVAASKE